MPGVSTGRHCDGYLTERVHHRGSETLTDARELRSFEHYREKTAFQLSGYFDHDFWTDTALRVAETSLAIKHSLVAIGALHESLEISYSTWLHDLADSIQLFALEQYNKSIALLTQKDTPAASIEVMLVSCILFVTIQTLQRKRSVDLLQKGLHMLRLWQKSNGKARSFAQLQKSTEKVSQNIVEMMDRIGVSTTIFVQFTNHDLFGDPDAEHIELIIPEQFHDLHEAKTTFDHVFSDLFLSVEERREHGDTEETGPLVAKFVGYLDRWWASFQRLLSSMGPMKDDARCAALALHVHYHIARIELAVAPTNNQMLFDDHLDSFRAIVHFTGEYLEVVKLSADARGTREEGSMPKTTISFGLEPGVISALFWIALHCRDPHIRREAISQMHSAHRREGAYDSITAAKITSKMVDIEEGYMGSPPVTCEDVPVEARLIFLSGNFHGIDPEQSRPRAPDEAILEALESSRKGKDILRPAQPTKHLIPFPDNLMICRYVKKPWKVDINVTEVHMDLNDDINLPGYTQPSPRYDWQSALKQRHGEIEELSKFYREEQRRSSEREMLEQTGESTNMLGEELEEQEQKM